MIPMNPGSTSEPRRAVAGIDEVLALVQGRTRREALLALFSGPRRAAELAGPLGVELAYLSRELRALERAGLVRSTQQGQERVYTPAAAELGRLGNCMILTLRALGGTVALHLPDPDLGRLGVPNRRPEDEDAPPPDIRVPTLGDAATHPSPVRDPGHHRSG
jgi:DNA-binding HxlR family transcriptional regulator